LAEGKNENKKKICARFNLNEDNPLIVFIGRMVGEKAADVLPDAILASLYSLQGNANFLILGSGEPHVEWQFNQLTEALSGNYNVFIGYDEALSHEMYASADFLLMPSRVEPCGLNQMYSMKYGTVPIVRNTGGLRDTVVDMGDGGWGIRFEHASVGDITHAVSRAAAVYKDKKEMKRMQRHMMTLDHSWENAVQQYINVYQSLKCLIFQHQCLQSSSVGVPALVCTL
jgi:starch synthase